MRIFSKHIDVETKCVIRIPMTFLIGSDGKVKFIMPGEIEGPDKLLREKVEKLLQ